MIKVSDYSLKEGENGVWYVIVHEPFGKCNLCGKGILKYRDSCPRICREIDEKGMKNSYRSLAVKGRSSLIIIAI